MNLNQRYTRMWDRSDLVDYLSKKNYKRVLDIGGSRTQIEFADMYISHILDLQKPTNDKIGQKSYFIGDCCHQEVWNAVLEDVDKNGKFDFVICTHTLEDLALPSLSIKMFPKVAEEGYIAVPSKYAECIHREGRYSGYFHHRWVFDLKKDGSVLGIPKTPILESIKSIEKLYQVTKETHLAREELQFFWKQTPNVNFIEAIDIDIVDHYKGMVDD